MRARARVVAEAATHQECRIVEMSGDAPLGLRATRDAIYLVATAQGLVGDDDLEIEVIVAPGATLRVRSAAATIAYTSHDARLSVACSVGSGGFLDWHPEPLIATAHCHTAIRSKIALDAGARLSWHEECLLGRVGEPPGNIELAVSVDYDNRPLLRHELVVGSACPAWDGPAQLGHHRAVGYRVIAGCGPRPSPASGEDWAILELEGPGAVLSAIGSDHAALRRAMAAGLGEDAR